LVLRVGFLVILFDLKLFCCCYCTGDVKSSRN